MKPVRFHEAATGELDEAVAYYDAQREGLGQALLSEVERATTRIRKYPEIGAPYNESEFRHVVLHRFPYAIFYTELPDTIWIVAVAHGRRRPGYWRDRIV